MRTGTYLKAIMRNKHLFQGKVNIIQTSSKASSGYFPRLSWMLAVALASSPFSLLKQEQPRLAFVLFCPTKGSLCSPKRINFQKVSKRWVINDPKQYIAKFPLY